MSFTTTALLVTWFAIVLLALALAGIVRQVRSLVMLQGIRLNPVGPALGSAAPPIEATDAYVRGRSTILLFVDAGCPSCEQVLAQLASLAGTESAENSDFVVVFPDDANGFRNDLVRVLANRRSLFDSFRVPAAPFAVLVTGEGIVARAAPIGSSEMFQRFVSTYEEGVIQ